MARGVAGASVLRGTRDGPSGRERTNHGFQRRAEQCRKTNRRDHCQDHPNDKGNPPGKLADAECHFAGGALEGPKLSGFSIWEQRGGNGRNVDVPGPVIRWRRVISMRAASDSRQTSQARWKPGTGTRGLRSATRASAGTAVSEREGTRCCQRA